MNILNHDPEDDRSEDSTPTPIPTNPPPIIEWPRNTIEKGEKGNIGNNDNYFEK